MGERVIRIESANPVEIYGVNDSHLDLLRKHFPRLKIVARGDTLKVTGEEEELAHFEMKLNFLLDYYDKFGKLSEGDVQHILGGGDNIREEIVKDADNVILFGNNGLVVKARTANQRRITESIVKNDMVFCVGLAGTGKTYTAVALAVKALKNKEVKRIILTRPAVEAGENLGFLPGDFKEKLDPYLQPLYDALYDMIPPEKLETFIENRIIEIAPLAFMRGRTLDNAFVILDEAQNATENQVKMFLTRMGANAKFIVTGDITQIDLPRNQPSGLVQAIKILEGIKGIDFIFLDESDIVRHKLVKQITQAYEAENKNKKP
ncbi:MAG: PhoH family protein [Bacteroidota bacterium]